MGRAFYFVLHILWRETVLGIEREDSDIDIGLVFTEPIFSFP
ncbi:MAG: hypothetical protein ABDH34_03695 [Dictyoglomus thermophilum]